MACTSHNYPLRVLCASVVFILFFHGKVVGYLENPRDPIRGDPSNIFIHLPGHDPRQSDHSVLNFTIM